MSLIYADLHIHSVLSPCADREMIPEKIYKQLSKMGIHIFAICDHNSTKNVNAFYEYGKKYYPDILFIPGIEITTMEEVHILGLFEDLSIADEVGNVIRDSLVDIDNMPEFFESQNVIDMMGQKIDEEVKALYYATNYEVEEAVLTLKKYNALVIAGHIDRPSFSVISQLGFIPENLFDVLEISPVSVKNVLDKNEFKVRDVIYKVPEHIPLITSSDSHSVGEIGFVKTGFYIDSLTFNGLKEAIKRKPIMEVCQY
ncbi:MAG TPA: PHP domain-containing protein [Candidatus Hydrogenedens sp.]|nr:PHP domain-containing protein [Candidatus Hydrogenedens sp.]HOL19880.1 PHP domain-containing protein [Candidatus Hydrogenedens sp.]HPP59803.1 PHP domain-containing protein [Candidatus Hydrogenedens sp.]